MAIGVVDYAAAVGVLPWNLCRRFTRSQVYQVRENRYPDGQSQRDLLTETSRKAWQLTIPLAPDELTELRTFYEEHAGGHIPFTFYDVNETAPAWHYDDTGVAVSGKYTCRFDSPWDQNMGVGYLRATVDLRIVEVR